MGGVYFRLDDNHPAAQWKQYETLFAKYGLKHSLAVNMTNIACDPASISVLQDLQSHGEEIMDHTPDHLTQAFSRVTDTASYSGLAGVDHISLDKVCLRYIPVDTATMVIGSGFADVYNDLLTTRGPGGFANFFYVRQIYFPSLNLLCNIDPVSIRNSEPATPDSLRLRDAWDDPVSLGLRSGLRYMLVGNCGGRLTDDALRLLADRSLTLFQKCGLAPPVSWIQPGGLMPNLSREDARRIYGVEHHYRSASVYFDRSLKVFNEYDPNDDMRFGLMWGDFDEESQSARDMEAYIADQVARHFVVCGLNHFSSSLGGWEGLLARTDSLLAWCVRSGIPVRTQAQWTAQLHDSAPDPYENIIPPLNVDLDSNGVPDGYLASVDGLISKADGVPDSSNCAYGLKKPGKLCSIGKLGGVEKGDNDFILWLKGTPGGKVVVTLRLLCASINPYSDVPAHPYGDIVLSYAVRDTAWRKYRLTDALVIPPLITIPVDVSLITVDVAGTPPPGGVVKISGMEMHRRMPCPPLLRAPIPP